MVLHIFDDTIIKVPDVIPFPFGNTYARLPERFFARVLPTSFSAPRLIRLNGPLADQLGLDPYPLVEYNKERN